MIITSDNISNVKEVVNRNIVNTKKYIKTHKDYCSSFAFYPLKIHSSKFPVKLTKKIGPKKIENFDMIVYEIVAKELKVVKTT